VQITLACAGSAVFLLPFLAAQLPGYEHVGQALRFCLSDLVIMKHVPARTYSPSKPGRPSGPRLRYQPSYLPRAGGGKVMTAADVRRLHKYMLEIEKAQPYQMKCVRSWKASGRS
jgi:hypothetical protein